MNPQHRPRFTPCTTPGFGRSLLLAFLDSADEALRQSRREEEEQAADDDRCRLRQDYSRQTRGYRETG